MYTRAYRSKMCRTSLSASSCPRWIKLRFVGHWLRILVFTSNITASEVLERSQPDAAPESRVMEAMQVTHLGRIRAVALLPQELARADEGRGLLELPAHHVGPLIQPQRQVAVAADPLRAT